MDESQGQVREKERLFAASVLDRFVNPVSLWVSILPHRDSKEAQDEAMAKLARREGDHLTLVNIYNSYLEAGSSAEWCQEQFLNHRSLMR